MPASTREAQEQRREAQAIWNVRENSAVCASWQHVEGAQAGLP
jgi:hypothetical protein